MAEPLYIKVGRHALAAISPLIRSNWTLNGSRKSPKIFKNIDDLVQFHFSTNSDESHLCRPTLNYTIEKLGGTAACIIETGSSAWGANSSLLFDSYVENYGGVFETVDIRINPSLFLKRKCCAKTFLHCDDSVSFLKKWSAKNKDTKIDLLYLDSWDMDWHDPAPSALHGLAEFLAISDNLKNGSLLLIDDTPKNALWLNKINPTYAEVAEKYFQKNGFFPGKGVLVKQLLQSMGRGKLLMHEYQLLWQF